MRTRRNDLPCCTAGRRSNQRLAITSPRPGGVRSHDQRRWSDANAKARDAFLLRPTEPESWRAFARLGFRTNQWAAALEWWQNVDDANRLTVEDRRDYIAAALAAGEVSLAAKQVQVLMAQRAPEPSILFWPDQLAKSQNDPVSCTRLCRTRARRQTREAVRNCLRCNARSLAD